MVRGSDKDMDFYIMLGSMPQIMDRFTSITGKPFTLPAVFTNKVYLPAGTWIDYWTGKKYNG